MRLMGVCHKIKWAPKHGVILTQTGHVSVIANLGHLLPGVTACCDSLVLLLMFLSQLIFKKVINYIAQLYHSDDY
jgi:hypothetical protein